MKFDSLLLVPQMAQIPEVVKEAEAVGFDGFFTAETNSDPFLSLTLAAEHSKNIQLGTAIAVTFPRSPAILAMLAWNLAAFSNGRFLLGLGTQVRAHNERRLGAKWEKPVRKMRETIEAMHAIWDNWQDGTPLNYEGEFFKLNLMTPFFAPPPLKTGKPPVYIAAVNELMLRLVGKRCDGGFVHSFHTVKYLQEYARPSVEKGLMQTERQWSDVNLASVIFAVPTDGSKPASFYEQFVKQQISFYMSTPAYRIVVELHGWEETAYTLSKMARKGAWDEMPNLITDEMLSEMAISGSWSELPRIAVERYDGLLDRIGYYIPFDPAEKDEWAQTLTSFREVVGSSA